MTRKISKIYSLKRKFQDKTYIIDVQTVVFWCRRAAWQFPTPDIFQAVKQGLMLAQEQGNRTYLNQLDARNL